MTKATKKACTHKRKQCLDCGCIYRKRKWERAMSCSPEDGKNIVDDWEQRIAVVEGLQREALGGIKSQRRELDTFIRNILAGMDKKLGKMDEAIDSKVITKEEWCDQKDKLAAACDELAKQSKKIAKAERVAKALQDASAPLRKAVMDLEDEMGPLAILVSTLERAISCNEGKIVRLQMENRKLRSILPRRWNKKLLKELEVVDSEPEWEKP